jgi:hypothetical protein
MRTNLLNDLSNVLKKGTSLSEKGTSLNLLPKMDRECIENDSRMDRQSLGKIFRYAAMITLLLTLACGNVWGM